MAGRDYDCNPLVAICVCCNQSNLVRIPIIYIINLEELTGHQERASSPLNRPPMIGPGGAMSRELVKPKICFIWGSALSTVIFST